MCRYSMVILVIIVDGWPQSKLSFSQAAPFVRSNTYSKYSCWVIFICWCLPITFADIDSTPSKVWSFVWPKVHVTRLRTSDRSEGDICFIHLIGLLWARRRRQGCPNTPIIQNFCGNLLSPSLLLLTTRQVSSPETWIRRPICRYTKYQRRISGIMVYMYIRYGRFSHSSKVCLASSC